MEQIQARQDRRSLMYKYRKLMVICLVAFQICVLMGCQNGSQNSSQLGESQHTESEIVTGSETATGSENVTGSEVTTETSTDVATNTESESNSESETVSETESEIVDLHEYDFTICYAGDFQLADGAVTTNQLEKSENGIYGCISPELIAIMQEADIMCLNSEFVFSTNGEPLKGKKYTFRGNPSRVSVYQELGVDVVTLANNHVYDYGKQAMLDTFTTFEEAGIEYFGAGRTLEDAMKPVYYEVDGKIIALVGASRAEKYKMTPQATETTPGILRCYDTELFLQVIEEADANADFVIAYVHWGTEYSTVLEKAQLTTGKDYLDAGADVIIGAHSHCIQGMEYYDGKPIVYSLGNYWFNSKTLDTMLVQLHFTGNDEGGKVEVSVVPALQKNSKTSILTKDSDIEKFFAYLEKISVNIKIDENGIVREKE